MHLSLKTTVWVIIGSHITIKQAKISLPKNVFWIYANEHALKKRSIASSAYLDILKKNCSIIHVLGYTLNC